LLHFPANSNIAASVGREIKHEVNLAIGEVGLAQFEPVVSAIS